VERSGDLPCRSHLYSVQTAEICRQVPRYVNLNRKLRTAGGGVTSEGLIFVRMFIITR
jgi:hypothetical protein